MSLKYSVFADIPFIRKQLMVDHMHHSLIVHLENIQTQFFTNIATVSAPDSCH